MINRPASSQLLIMDACVLIDFLNADRTVLQSIVTHVGPLHILSSIMDEVHEIRSKQELEDLGFVIIEPALEDAFAAGDVTGPTSFQDRLCMLTAKRNQMTCVTNDKQLRQLCGQEKVPIVWGLQLIVLLHGSGGIPADNAIQIAEAIHRSNPRHINQSILKRFVASIRDQEQNR